MTSARLLPLPTLTALVAALILSACADPRPAPTDSPGSTAMDNSSAKPASLDGTAWVLADLAGKPPLAGGQVPTIRFESGQARGTDGCNRYTLPFNSAGADLTFGPTGPMTQMACTPEIMSQAHALRTALEGTRRFAIASGRLTLQSADGTTLAILSAQNTGIVGTWEVTAYNNGREAVVGVLKDAPLEMTFAADGSVTGSAGCNRFTATYKDEGGTFRFTPAAATRRMCPGEGVMEQENAFLKALATVATKRTEGDTAEFRTSGDALALMLRRLPSN